MMPALVIRNVNVIDGLGTDTVAAATVVVVDDRIADIQTGPAVTPAGATVIDGGGGFLMPGLIDGHVHAGAMTHDMHNQHRLYPTSLLAIHVYRRLAGMLDAGFTTVRDAGGIDGGFRQAIDEGLTSGPRLIVSGRPLSQTGGHGDSRYRAEPGDHHWDGEFGMTHVIADGEAAVRHACREEFRRGADVIKVFASGGAMSPADRLDSTQYSVGELAVACEEAAAVKSYVMAHALTPRSIQNCALAGVRTVEHGNLLDEASAKVMVDSGMYLVPTVIAYEYAYEKSDEFGRPADIKEKLRIGAERGREAVEIAARAGVLIGSGSDLLGNPALPLMGQEIAIQASVQGPLEAIRSATSVNAQMLGLDDRIGSVQVGKQADLIVVAEDPIANPAALGTPDRIPLVVKDGVVVKNRL